MFGFGGFDNDPFFEDTPLRMQSSFGPSFNMADPFGMFGGSRAALTGPERSNDALARQNDNMMLPFGGRSPFDSMFQQFELMANNPNAHTFSSSTVMSYSSGGDGQQPQVYRASKSTRTGPGGIKETRRQVQDSVSGIQKMSVGHQIGDRSHTIGKSYNSKTNEEMETHDFVNMDEDESDTFERDWDGRIHSFKGGDMIMSGKYRLPSERMAISSHPHHSNNHDDITTKEKKEKRHHHHREHPELDNELMGHDHSARTRPHHSHREYDTNAPLHHERMFEPEVDHHRHHSIPKAPGVSHRSSKHKVVDFSEVDEKPTRKQHHHYHSGHTRDDHHHRPSTKKPSTLV